MKIYVSPTFGVSNYTSTEAYEKRYNDYEPYIVRLKAELRDGACLDELTTNKALQETIRAERAAYEGEGDYQADPQNL